MFSVEINDIFICMFYKLLLADYYISSVFIINPIVYGPQSISVSILYTSDVIPAYYLRLDH